ncbi:MAG: hypothetical protein K6L76_06525 [Agarilytica sp.]
MKYIKYLAFIVTVLGSTYVNAAWHTAKIVTIHTYLNGGVVVYVSTDHQCGSNKISLDETAPGFDRAYSALLAYEAQKKDVKFTIQTCNGETGVTDRIVSIN